MTDLPQTDPASVPAATPVPTSAARLGLRERVRQLPRPAAVNPEHVGGRPTLLRWSGLAAS